MCVEERFVAVFKCGETSVCLAKVGTAKFGSPFLFVKGIILYYKSRRGHWTHITLKKPAKANTKDAETR